MKPIYKIKQWKILENDDMTGISAVSLVDDPAIELPWEYFNNHRKEIWKAEDIKETDLDATYKWVLGADDMDICPSCSEWAASNPRTLRDWISTALPRIPVGETILGLQTQQGWTGTRKTEGGPTYNTYCEDGCRCHLELVENFAKENYIELKVENEEKGILSGPILVSGKLIYRKDVDGQGNPGFGYFSRDTVRKIQKKYGLNRKITLMHREDITGTLIMTKSYLLEDDKNNKTTFMGQYQCISEKLKEYIKAKKVIGFSLEGLFI